MADSGFLELEKGTSAPSAGATDQHRVYPDESTGAITHKYPNGTTVNLEANAITSTDQLPEGVVNLYFTNERAQDAVGSILQDTNSIDLTYNDGANTITADLKLSANSADPGNLRADVSIESSGSSGLLVQVPEASGSQTGVLTSGDWTTFNNKEPAITAGTTSEYYRGDKVFVTLDTDAVPEGTNKYFTDERAQDAVGSTLTDSDSVDMTYNDGANTIKSDLRLSVAAADSGYFKITNDIQSSPNQGLRSQVQIASASQTGVLTSTDWNTFNNKEPAITVLPVSKGGTNSSTALNNNRIMRSDSGQIIEAAAITASRALISDANGIPTHSPTTSTEIGYVSGVTSAIQTQINAKLTDPMTTIGDTLYRNASNITDRLPIGTADQLLRVVSGVPAWSDENLGQDFGDGSNGNATISAALPLTQPAYYNTLTLVAGCVITTNGYPIYCKTLDLSNAPAGAIVWNGFNGGNASNQTGGTSSTALAAAMLGGGGGVGTTGATGTINAGTTAGATGAVNPGNGGNAGNGGTGGTGVNAGGGTGTSGTVTNRVIFGRFEQQFLRGAALISGGSSGRGGSSGGGDGVSVLGRGGGGGGSSGAVIAIYADTIITSASTASGVIQSHGGNGGNGANGINGAGGGGGGGAGGGGYVFLGYNYKIGPVITNLISANGGTGGNGGTGTGVNSTAGTGGNGGSGGYIDAINFGTLTGTHVSGSAGSAATGTTGGTGGTCYLSL